MPVQIAVQDGGFGRHLYQRFTINDQTVTAANFGKVTTLFAGSRVFQFQMQYRF